MIIAPVPPLLRPALRPRRDDRSARDQTRGETADRKIAPDDRPAAPPRPARGPGGVLALALALAALGAVPAGAQSLPGLAAASDAATSGAAARATGTSTPGTAGKTGAAVKSSTAPRANPCAQYGAGFQQAPGSSTCVKVTGAIRIDAGSGGSIGNAPNSGTDIVTEGTPVDPWKLSR